MRRGIERAVGLHSDWERPRPELGRSDLIIAAGIGLLALVSLELARSGGGLQHTDAPYWSMVLVVLSGAGLLVGRRRWPLAVAALAAAHMFVSGVTMPEVMAQLPSQIVYFTAIFSGVAWARDRGLMAVVIGSIIVFMFAWIGWQFAVGSAIQDWLGDEAQGRRLGLVPRIPAAIAFSFLVNVVYFGGAVVGGLFAWHAARDRARMQEQAQTIAAQAERLREQAVIDERLRIARELHDVVAHHVSAMGIQAGAARTVLERDPEGARAALAAIEDGSREAVDQMRSLLGTLRAGESSDGSRTSDPGLADLGPLLDEQTDSGLRVSLDVVENPADAAQRLPRQLGLAMYRTVQEALTNVRRHSTATTASVVVRVDEAAAKPFAEVEVIDDGRPRGDSSGSGLGQLGIRERASSHRAEVEIGPRVSGGYRVRVRYPLGDPS